MNTSDYIDKFTFAGIWQSFRNRSSQSVERDSSVYNIVRNYNALSSKSIRQSEWFGRLYIESVCHPEMHAYMLTLTYNDIYIPSFNCKDGTVHRGHINPNKSSYRNGYIPCFFKRDGQLFFKRLRKHFSVHYPDVKIKYLFCSEYGSQNTKRSHHHVCLMVYGDVPLRRLRNFVKKSWVFVNKYKKSISLGAVNFGKSPFGDTFDIICANGYNYVAKYITKDCWFSSNPHYQSMPDQFKEDFERNFAPYKTSSTNLGSDWHLHFDVYDSLYNGIKVKYYSKKSGTFEYKTLMLPYYCQDRYFYNHFYTNVQISDSESVYVHTKRLKDDLVTDFYNLKYHRLIESSRYYSIKLNMPYDDVFCLLVWRDIRSRILSPLTFYSVCSRYSLDCVVPDKATLNVMYWYFNGSTHSEYLPEYKFKYDRYNESLAKMGYTSMLSTPVASIMDDRLRDFLVRLSEYSESSASERRRRDADIKATRESYNYLLI